MCPNNNLILKNCRVATVREKYLENEFFSRSENLVDGQGNLERTLKGYSRQSSVNQFILFRREMDVFFSHEIV